ncbi:magnesium transporter NIPA2-like isoform X2 [Corythoichthys intestinalis]|uniref:magnesium transporter NIPA2-like isoform X2 n=1 Tax=Corythoichthys intestinalis TaxID=161448 RepID=UPI0025A5A1E2|nr:magnesium transporter NIPA2-like isoform X2 [Corythoichthys intestinalis]
MRIHNASCGREVPTRSVYSQWAGLSLALLSAVLIGGSVVLKKKALLRLASRGQTRAGDGGHGYLKDGLWWSGLLTMGAGEACNFAAYVFASATLVTPLGALSVLCSALLSSCLLGEVLNVLCKMGCTLCVLGSVLLVIHAPQEQEVTSLWEMSHMLIQPGFVAYMSCVSGACAFLMWVSCRRPAVLRANMLPDVAVCSLLGAFTVSSVKGLAGAIRSALHDAAAALSAPLTWALLVTLLIAVATQVLNPPLTPTSSTGEYVHSLAQVHFLNKSLDTFGPLLVYPVYYVLFTTVVLVTSAVLLGEWSRMAATDTVTTVGAFMVMAVGVAMLQLFKDARVSRGADVIAVGHALEPATLPTTRMEEELAEEAVARGSRTKKEDKRRLVNSTATYAHPVAEQGVFVIS